MLMHVSCKVIAKLALLVSVLLTALQVFRTYGGPSKFRIPTTSIPWNVQPKEPENPDKNTSSVTPQSLQVPVSSRLSLPSVYTASHPSSSSCENKYGLAYLYDTASTGRPYCDIKSGSQLSCFHNNMGGRIDTFCMASKMTLPPKSTNFELDCHIRDWNAVDLAGSPRIENFREDWYSTGLGWIFKNHISISEDRTPKTNMVEAGEHTSESSHTILIKREGHSNIWHTLMEIFSYTMSMDILHLYTNPQTGRPLFTETDANSTQIIMIDDGEEGPYYELWQILARRPIQRLSKMKNKKALHFKNVVIPLPGATNPVWQDHWTSVDCTKSQTLSVFIDRILERILVPQGRDPAAPIVVTFIDRKGSRRIKEQEKLFSDLNSDFPDVQINVVDFANIKFRKQVALIQKTDVLVGVTGAGLTHSLFLRPRSCLVEILPQEINLRAFRNVAKLRDLSYFSGHASQEQTQGNSGKDWHYNDINIEREKFKNVMRTAIASMFNRGVLEMDVA